MRPLTKTIISGIGFLSDSYDLFVINIVIRILAVLYPTTNAASASDIAAVGTAALLGAVAGQLVCGSLADTLGRRKIFILTLVLIVVGSLGSATATHSKHMSLYTQLALWRGVLGFGVGGEYPLSATVTSESSSTAGRGKAVSSVFAMQGVGNLLASVVTLSLLYIDVLPLDVVWRLALALGALPGLITVRWRWKMEESEHFVRASQAGGTGAATGAPPGDGIEMATAVAASRRSSQASSDGEGERVALVHGTQKTTRPFEETTARPVLVSPDGSRTGARRQAMPRQDTLEMDEYDERSPLPASRNSATDHELDASLETRGKHGEVPSATGDRPHTDGNPGATDTLVHASLLSRLATRVKTFAAQVWEIRWTLLGTAGSWFIVDIVLYGNGLFSAAVLHQIGIGGDDASAKGNGDGPELQRPSLAAQALGNTMLALIALPGYVVAVCLIDKLGRRRMQLLGFAAMTLLFVILAAAMSALISSSQNAVFVALYGLTFFFCNFGPNTTTFVIPSEAFPTRTRATGHGISAAAGKLGAALGAGIMPALLSAGGVGESADPGRGLMYVMAACAAISVWGWGWTYFLTHDTSGVDLEALDERAGRIGPVPNSSIDNVESSLP